jgi:hypothetical protein
MKALMTILLSVMTLNANADERWAHEYSSDNDQNWHKRKSSERNQQTPIQIYIAPNSQRFYFEDKETREDRRWRQRREELQRMPQTPYYENQYERDDTHW